MKLGTESKKKTLIAVGLVVVAAVLVVRAFMGGGDDSSSGATPATVQHVAAGHKPARMTLAHSLDPSLRFDLLKSSEDVTYKGNGRNIFTNAAAPVAADIPKPITPDVTPVKQGPPPPPPIDLKFYGFAGPKGGAKRIFLLKGEDIFLAREGDIVDRRYKIMHIGPASVEIQDVLTNNTQTIPLSAG